MVIELTPGVVVDPLWTFLLDEEMPRSTAGALRGAGHVAVDVRDVGLRGRSDPEIFAYAQAKSAILLTADSVSHCRGWTHADTPKIRTFNLTFRVAALSASS